jgi:hypothetical protein
MYRLFAHGPRRRIAVFGQGCGSKIGDSAYLVQIADIQQLIGINPLNKSGFQPLIRRM